MKNRNTFQHNGHPSPSPLGEGWGDAFSLSLLEESGGEAPNTPISNCGCIILTHYGSSSPSPFREGRGEAQTPHL